MTARSMGKGFLRHCRPLTDAAVRSKFRPLLVKEGSQLKTVGWMKPEAIDAVKPFTNAFTPQSGGVLVKGNSKEERTALVGDVIKKLAEASVITGWRNEIYNVSTGFFDEPSFEIERAAAGFFGIRTFGCHVNAYTVDSDGRPSHYWIAKRSARKAKFPGQLDQLVAGGISAGHTLRETVIKECAEEACIPREIAITARSVGFISYRMVSASASGEFKDGTQFCFDLEMPPDFVPNPGDEEVESMELVSVDAVTNLVANTDRVKFNCNLVIIDWLIRHSLYLPTDSNYFKVVEGLRVPGALPQAEP